MIKSKSTKPRKKKLQTITLSVLLSIVVWFMVMSLTNPNITTTISNLDVRFVGEMSLRDKQLAVIGRNDIPQLSVVVSGNRSDIMNLMDNIYVQVDLSNITSAGDYMLQGTISIPTTRITVEKEDYGDIPVTIEPLKTKDIDIEIKQTGTLKDKIVKSSAANEKVTISGAQSEIDKVDRAVATIDISEMTEDNTEHANYLLADSSGTFINTNETIESVRPDIEIINTIYEAKTLTVESVLSPELEKEYILKKSSISPAAVTVGVTDENTDEKIIAVIDKISNQSEEYELQSTNGMYIPPENSKVKITAETAKKSVVRLELEPSLENIPEGCSARINENITAMVWGEEGTVTAENVHAAADLSGLGKGTHTLPVYIKDDGFGFEDNYTVSVTIE